MKDNSIKKVNLQSYIKILPPKQNSQKAFTGILFPENQPLPLYLEIKNRENIVSGIHDKIEQIYINNSDFFTKNKNLNSNISYKNINDNHNKRKNKRKKAYQISSFNSNKLIKDKNYNYSNEDKKNQISQYRNTNYPLLRVNRAKTEFKNINMEINISEENKEGKYLIKEVETPCIKKEENKLNISSRNIITLSDLPIGNKNESLLPYKKMMKKAVSSNSFYKNNNSYNKNSTQIKSNYTNSNLSNQKEVKRLNLFSLKPSKSNITFSNYMSSYIDKKNYKNNFKISDKKSNLFLSNLFPYNSIKHIKNLNQSENKNDSNYEYLFSERNEEQKDDMTKNKILNFSPVIKLNKFKKINKIKIGNLRNLMEELNNFKNFFNKKIDFLKYQTHGCKRELIELIDTNNEKINDTKEKQFGKDKQLKEELDIRNDILDQSKSNTKKKNEKVLKNYKNYKLFSIREEKKINLMNQLKKKINQLSDTRALYIVEQCMNKSEREKIDIKKLMKESNDRKNEKLFFKIDDIRKRAKNNYEKILKLKYNL